MKYRCGIAIENLDFANLKKKMSSNKKYNRMLSSFPYSKFKEMIESMCFRYGIELKIVDACYTSFIGRNKYMKNMGISVHHAAAIVIGRRAMNRSERFRNKEITLNNGNRVTCELPEWKGHKKRYIYLKTLFNDYHDLLKKSLLLTKQSSTNGSIGPNIIPLISNTRPI